MTNLLKTHNLYKLIILIFFLVSIIKIKNQFVTLHLYDAEIVTLNEKIATLEEQTNNEMLHSATSKEDNEKIARKDLKMYYPNETPYKGY